jgi:hypothetical protein
LNIKPVVALTSPLTGAQNGAALYTFPYLLKHVMRFFLLRLMWYPSLFERPLTRWRRTASLPLLISKTKIIRPIRHIN